MTRLLLDVLCKKSWNLRYCVPTPCTRAEKSRVSRTVSWPLWRSFWLTYIAVFWGTNSSWVCPLKVTDPFTCTSRKITCSVITRSIPILHNSLLYRIILISMSILPSSSLEMNSPLGCYQAFQRVWAAVLSFLNWVDPTARSSYTIEINEFSDSLDHRKGYLSEKKAWS